MAWVIGILVVALIAWGLSPARPFPNPIPHERALTEALRTLLNQGLHHFGRSGRLVVCIKTEPERRLVFTKYIRVPRDVGFQATVERSSWPDPHFDNFRSELDRREVRYDVSREGDPEVVSLNFGRDFSGAYAVTRILFEDVLGMRINRDCVMYAHDVLVRNIPSATGVDRSDEL